MEKNWVKLKEACEFLCIKSSTCHQKIRTDKDFPVPAKIGGLLLFRVNELEEYLEKKRIK